jgi:hypothetical protein
MVRSAAGPAAEQQLGISKVATLQLEMAVILIFLSRNTNMKCWRNQTLIEGGQP